MRGMAYLIANRKMTSRFTAHGLGRNLLSDNPSLRKLLPFQVVSRTGISHMHPIHAEESNDRDSGMNGIPRAKTALRRAECSRHSLCLDTSQVEEAIE